MPADIEVKTCSNFTRSCRSINGIKYGKTNNNVKVIATKVEERRNTDVLILLENLISQISSHVNAVFLRETDFGAKADINKASMHNKRSTRPPR